MSILSGPAIRAAIERGDIVIDPFDVKYVNPASVDLTLGEQFVLYVMNRRGDDCRWYDRVLDTKVDNEHERGHMGDGGCLVLYPGQLYLLHTVERVRTDKYVPVLDGKSSIGRLGVCVHLTAGFGDPGFDGQYTLEVTAVYPTRVYAGMRFCQIRFHTMERTRTLEEVDCGGMLYNGNYTGEASMGPVPSRSWKQFE